MSKSVIWSSMRDYPDNICTTMFTGVCNFDCEFCYNRGLLKEKEINFEEEILPKLLERKDFINHVIISGGECTIHPDFEKVINTLYDNGFTINNEFVSYFLEFASIIEQYSLIINLVAIVWFAIVALLWTSISVFMFGFSNAFIIVI